MGIPKLWDIASRGGKRVSLDALRGKVLAVDTSIWLMHLLTGIRLRNKGNETSSSASYHLQGLWRRVCKLIFCGIRPVFVFDGPTPPLKLETLRRRAAARRSKELDYAQLARQLLLNKLVQHALKSSLLPRTSLQPWMERGTSISAKDIIKLTHRITQARVQEGTGQKQLQPQPQLSQQQSPPQRHQGSSFAPIEDSSVTTNDTAMLSGFLPDDGEDEEDDDALLVHVQATPMHTSSDPAPSGAVAMADDGSISWESDEGGDSGAPQGESRDASDTTLPTLPKRHWQSRVSHRMAFDQLDESLLSAEPEVLRMLPPMLQQDVLRELEQLKTAVQQRDRRNVERVHALSCVPVSQLTDAERAELNDHRYRKHMVEQYQGDADEAYANFGRPSSTHGTGPTTTTITTMSATPSSTTTTTGPSNMAATFSSMQLENFLLGAKAKKSKASGVLRVDRGAVASQRDTEYIFVQSGGQDTPVSTLRQALHQGHKGPSPRQLPRRLTESPAPTNDEASKVKDTVVVVTSSESQELNGTTSMGPVSLDEDVDDVTDVDAEDAADDDDDAHDNTVSISSDVDDDAMSSESLTLALSQGGSLFQLAPMDTTDEERSHGGDNVPDGLTESEENVWGKSEMREPVGMRATGSDNRDPVVVFHEVQRMAARAAARQRSQVLPPQLSSLLHQQPPLAPASSSLQPQDAQVSFEEDNGDAVQRKSGGATVPAVEEGSTWSLSVVAGSDVALDDAGASRVEQRSEGVLTMTVSDVKPEVWTRPRGRFGLGGDGGSGKGTEVRLEGVAADGVGGILECASSIASSVASPASSVLERTGDHWAPSVPALVPAREGLSAGLEMVVSDVTPSKPRRDSMTPRSSARDMDQDADLMEAFALDPLASPRSGTSEADDTTLVTIPRGHGKQDVLDSDDVSFEEEGGEGVVVEQQQVEAAAVDVDGVDSDPATVASPSATRFHQQFGGAEAFVGSAVSTLRFGDGGEWDDHVFVEEGDALLPNVLGEDSSLDPEVESFRRAEEEALAREHRNAVQRLQESLAQEQAELAEQADTARRGLQSLSEKTISEAKALLRLFGLPYVEASGEAEAQCAYLERMGLVDGVVTDDSDVFLFGGRCVYRNLFRTAEYVELYEGKALESGVGLCREALLELGTLLGGDYDDGIKGAGAVLAMEMVNWAHALLGEQLDDVAQSTRVPIAPAVDVSAFQAYDGRIVDGVRVDLPAMRALKHWRDALAVELDRLRELRGTVVDEDIEGRMDVVNEGEEEEEEDDEDEDDDDDRDEGEDDDGVEVDEKGDSGVMVDDMVVGDKRPRTKPKETPERDVKRKDDDEHKSDESDAEHADDLERDEDYVPEGVTRKRMRVKRRGSVNDRHSKARKRQDMDDKQPKQQRQRQRKKAKRKKKRVIRRMDDLMSVEEARAFGIRTRQHEVFAKRVLRLELPDTFPRQRIVEEYLNPNVDSSMEPFSWGDVRVDQLKAFAAQHMAWSPQQVMQALEPILRQQRALESGDTQTRMPFFFSEVGARIPPRLDSLRFRQAVRQRIAQHTRVPIASVPLAEPQPETEEQAARKRARRARKEAAAAASGAHTTPQRGDVDATTNNAVGDEDEDDEVRVNRAPVLTLWAAVVAQLKFDPLTWPSAVSLGSALCKAFSQVKGRAIGVLRGSDPMRGLSLQQRMEMMGIEHRIVTLLSSELAVCHVDDGSVCGYTPQGNLVRPEHAVRYVQRAFGSRLPRVLAAMRALADSWTAELCAEDDAGGTAYRLYERIRPDVAPGREGWGQKGVLSLRVIDGARKEARGDTAGQGEEGQRQQAHETSPMAIILHDDDDSAEE